MAATLQSLSRRLAADLLARRARIAVAESCTGGLVAATCTSLPGSSMWFDCGIVAYNAAAKSELLGVPSATIDACGVVSEATARAMAEGVLSRSSADLSVAVTGVAGPDGGTPEVPVGTVWFAWACRRGRAIDTWRTARHALDGGRRRIRNRCVEIALKGLIGFTG